MSFPRFVRDQPDGDGQCAEPKGSGGVDGDDLDLSACRPILLFSVSTISVLSRSSSAGMSRERNRFGTRIPCKAYTSAPFSCCLQSAGSYSAKDGTWKDAFEMLISADRNDNGKTSPMNENSREVERHPSWSPCPCLSPAIPQGRLSRPSQAPPLLATDPAGASGQLRPGTISKAIPPVMPTSQADRVSRGTPALLAHAGPMSSNTRPDDASLSSQIVPYGYGGNGWSRIEIRPRRKCTGISAS